MKTFDRSGVSTGLFSMRYFQAGKRIWATLIALVAAIVLIMPVSVLAKRVEMEKAENLAQRFAESRQRQHGRPGRAEIRLKHAAKRQGQGVAGWQVVAPSSVRVGHSWMISSTLSRFFTVSQGRWPGRRDRRKSLKIDVWVDIWMSRSVPAESRPSTAQ